MSLNIHNPSDLHLEFDGNPSTKLPDKDDAIILAGDIYLKSPSYRFTHNYN